MAIQTSVSITRRAVSNIASEDTIARTASLNECVKIDGGVKLEKLVHTHLNGVSATDLSKNQSRQTLTSVELCRSGNSGSFHALKQRCTSACHLKMSSEILSRWKKSALWRSCVKQEVCSTA